MYLCLDVCPQFMDLRTRYTALVTLTTQHVKYISDALRRLEEEEVGQILFNATCCFPIYMCCLHFVVRLRNVVYCLRLVLKMFSTCFFSQYVQKEVEEERQARVSQVSDLLGWVKGLQGRTGGPNAESSLAAQQVKQKSGSWSFVQTVNCVDAVNVYCTKH